MSDAPVRARISEESRSARFALMERAFMEASSHKDRTSPFLKLQRDPGTEDHKKAGSSAKAALYAIDYVLETRPTGATVVVDLAFLRGLDVLIGRAVLNASSSGSPVSITTKPMELASKRMSALGDVHSESFRTHQRWLESSMTSITEIGAAAYLSVQHAIRANPEAKEIPIYRADLLGLKRVLEKFVARSGVNSTVSPFDGYS